MSSAGRVTCARRCAAYDRRVLLQHRLRLSLVAAQVVGVLTLLRSIAFDRWITVLASLFLIGGAMAAQRGRTWGIPMALAAAVAFPVAFAIGIAPPWFCLVGIAGALPFAISARPFARFDKGATMLLAAITTTLGAAAAIAWKEVAWSVFMTFPSLMPSIHAQHGVALAATLAVVVGALAGRARHPAEGAGTESFEGEARVRIGERVRIGNDATGSAHADAFEEEAERELARDLELDGHRHGATSSPLPNDGET
ncbi:MAG: hypothetical protein JWO86_6629 [Myxococcaceae bacterium]|nr:hypothetical protein [Myxococcaceae bacterium]